MVRSRGDGLIIINLMHCYLTQTTKVLLLSLFGLFGSYLQAQTDAPQEEQSRPLTIGINTGTNAFIGIDVATPISERWNMRLDFSYMHLNLRKWETNFNRFEHYASIDMDIEHSAFNVLFDYATGEKGNFRLVGGLGFFIGNQASGSVRLADNFTFNDIAFEPDELGYVHGGVRFRSRINPYLGIGIGRLHSRKRVSFSMDIGTFYKGAPQIRVGGTQLLRNNEHNSEVLTDNLSPYRWYPVLRFRLGYSLNPVKN